jgi:hypothetical protein
LVRTLAEFTLARDQSSQSALLAEPVKELQVESIERARLGPLGKTAPGGDWRAAAELLSRQEAPRGGASGRVDDRPVTAAHQAGRLRFGRAVVAHPANWWRDRQLNRAACDQRYCSRLGHASTAGECEREQAHAALDRRLAKAPVAQDECP